ncbi:MAG: methionine adenosyltransferase [Candidatus Dadabacteria bacterium]|nr:MAG: methionine adenosyltransferase [Candidatus Dadabacteria bacterium]
MEHNYYIFTSEGVSEGHPDKICDQISDAILDKHLAEDPDSRIACEALVKNFSVVIAGEITSRASPNIEEIVAEVLEKIGYKDSTFGFCFKDCQIYKFLSQQSPDIGQGVDEDSGLFKEQGAGDQGIMFGYACNETERFMPMPIYLSHKILKELAKQRKENENPLIGPDSKAQVSVKYENDVPTEITTVVVSTQHKEEFSLKDLREYVVEEVIKKSVPQEYLTPETLYYVNPTGRFVIGGPIGDAGLTGRKIIVDTYGGSARHGGGAFSGKDPTKVDRSAAYMARYIAKNVVAAGIAKKCEVQFAYVIGVAKPVSLCVNTFGTSEVPESVIAKAIEKVFPLTPKEIIETLNLKQPIYFRTAAYGHFGRQPTKEGHFSWEKTDKTEELKAACS